MANAFDAGRIGLFVISSTTLDEGSPANPGQTRLKSISQFANGLISDVYLREESPLSDFQMVRGTARPFGGFLKAQMWTQPSGRSASQYASDVSNRISVVQPGVILADIEVADDQLETYIVDFYNNFRVKRPGFLLNINIAPHKEGFLAGLANKFLTDPNLYASQQTYFGDMSRFAENEAADNLRTQVPDSKFELCYGAAGPVDRNGTRGITLPVWYNESPSVRLSRGLIYSDDLMVDTRQI